MQPVVALEGEGITVRVLIRIGCRRSPEPGDAAIGIDRPLGPEITVLQSAERPRSAAERSAGDEPAHAGSVRLASTRAGSKATGLMNQDGKFKSTRMMAGLSL